MVEFELVVVTVEIDYLDSCEEKVAVKVEE